jgi:hypothetical protein
MSYAEICGLVLGTGFAATLTCAVLHRIIHRDTFRRYHEVGYAVFLQLGVIFAVLLAFVFNNGLRSRIVIEPDVDCRLSAGPSDSNMGPILVARDRGEVFTPGISPAMGSHCNIGHLVDPKFRREFGDDLLNVPNDEPILSLDVEAPPITKSHLVRRGQYRLQLKIAASNCAVVDKTIELTLTGSWFEQSERMFREGLAIRIV